MNPKVTRQIIAKPIEVLTQFWGYPKFRSGQGDIIDAVLDGQDVFVSLPTGGGKSLCYQIPVMCQTGVGLVISPLVALMKDQINNLEKVGIKATELSGKMNQSQMQQVIDNCMYGSYKFLYLSPERFASEWVQEQLKRLPVNLLVVDEAHCISQWGHDFRPSYLKVSELKTLFPDVPLVALTATATKLIEEDIKKHIFTGAYVDFKNSFERKNIAYSVFKVEDKLHYVKRILTKNTKSSILYVRTRKACLHWNTILNQVGFKSTYYHGGLSINEKTIHMDLWINNNVQVIVATNAFGMGIDKADVQSVIHVDIPENIENYYQESGRAGRDGFPAHAVILYDQTDLEKNMYKTQHSMIDREFLVLFYKKLCSTIQLVYGEGFDIEFSIDFEKFCTKNNLSRAKSFESLQFLDRQHIIELETDFRQKTRVQLVISGSEIQRLIVNASPVIAHVLLYLIRNYSGIYEILTPINTSLIQEKSNINSTELHQILTELSQQQVLVYEPQSLNIRFRMLENREDEYTINRISKHLKQQNTLKIDKLAAIHNFITNKNTCKNKLLLNYFGEEKKDDCGICSYCIKKTKPEQSLPSRIKTLLTQNPLNSKDIALLLEESNENIVNSLHYLLEQQDIEIKNNNTYAINKS